MNGSSRLTHYLATFAIVLSALWSATMGPVSATGLDGASIWCSQATSVSTLSAENQARLAEIAALLGEDEPEAPTPSHCSPCHATACSTVLPSPLVLAPLSFELTRIDIAPSVGGVWTDVAGPPSGARAPPDRIEIRTYSFSRIA